MPINLFDLTEKTALITGGVHGLDEDGGILATIEKPLNED